MRGFIRGADGRRDYADCTENEKGLFADIGMIWARNNLAMQDFSADTEPLRERVPGPICSQSMLSIWQEQRVARRTAGTCFAATLGGNNRIITAAHCFDNAREGDVLRMVFGNYTGGAGLTYLSAKLIESVRDDDEDWAILRPLPVADTPGFPCTANPPYRLELATRETMPNSGPAYTVGFPHGLPAKVATGLLRGSTGTSLRTDLDVFEGNSGGPLIVDIGGRPKVVGIMREAVESHWVNTGGCIQEPTTCPVPGSPACWSMATKITEVHE